MSTTEVRIAVLSVVGAALSVGGILIGAWIAASSAERVAIAQIDSQRLLARSEAAMRLMDYAAAPMADIYAANMTLQQFDLSTMDDAARKLAISAAIGAARIGGDVARRCVELSRSADQFGKIPQIAESLKTDAAAKLGRDVSELMHAYDDYRKGLQAEVLPPLPPAGNN